MRLRRDGVSVQELDDEMVVLDLETSRYLSVNGSGTHLLRKLVTSQTADGLAKALVAEFDVEPARAEADVAAFIEQLDGLGLLEHPHSV